MKRICTGLEEAKRVLYALRELKYSNFTMEYFTKYEDVDNGQVYYTSVWVFQW